MRNLFHILIILFTLVGWPSESSGQVTEYEIKAAFLYNFGKFVEWPEETLRDPEAPFIIGILGQDPFGKILDRLVAEGRLKNHKITIKRFERLPDLEFCHILFIGKSEKKRLPDIIEKIEQQCILTVSEIQNFIDFDGMIGLITTPENKVRFEINLAAATDAGLKMSSRLLRLAQNLKGWQTNGKTK